jgi:sodium/potassium-transporting ATPase subunit alpha
MDGNLDWLRDRKFGGEVPSSASKGGVGGGGSMRALQFGGGSMKALNSGGSLRNIAIAPTAESKPSATGSSKAVATGDVAISVGSSAPGVGSFRRLKATYQIQRTTQELPYVDLMLIAAVNNSAKYDATDRSAVIGDASEAALLRFCDRFGVTDFFRQSYSVVFTVPFSSSTKFSAVVCEHPSFPDQHIILLKGAPEIVLEKCASYLDHDQAVSIDDRFRSKQKRAYERIASEGQRVLGFIRQIVPARDPSDYDIETFPKTGYQFVGMTGLTDPPKPGVPDCILALHEAEVRVFMVTGDHPFTAEAIGRQVNLITGPTVKDVAEDRGCDQADIDMLADDEVRSIVLPGSDIKDLTEDEWNRILAKPEIVFARTTPQQKLEIVKHCQRLGHLVAVTGDGVNDAPALKQANIGVSMGKNASDVAREAAAIILMDDNFPSIIHAIEAGRLIFDNLKKTIAYTLTHLWPEVVPVILALLFGLVSEGWMAVCVLS